MTISAMTSVKAFALIALGLAIAAMGLYVAEADDAPGAAVMGMLLMVGGLVLGVRAARNQLPAWAARVALAVGVVVAAFAALLIHRVVVTAPLVRQPQELPSAVSSAPLPQYAAAVQRARVLVRAAVLEQNLAGVSVAVGAGGAVVWAEGFGWRDIVTRAPVTPDTRFHIGTAASAVIPAVATLGLTHTGTDSAAEWSPGHVGEPEEDFPLFTLVHHIILRPIGIAAPAQPLPGERATFYVPRSDHDPRTGRRLMYMRDLACCAEKMAFSSTPSDLVRVALRTNPASIDGALAGGMVMSLMAGRGGGGGGGVVVAVTSNMAYTDTGSLARRIGDTFAEQVR